MENLKNVANSWLIAWALAYLFTAIFAPGLSGDVLTGEILYGVIGIALLVSVALLHTKALILHKLGVIVLLIVAAFSVYGAIASWSGLFVWNVPFANKEVFQVTMGLMDFLGAFFMLVRIILES
jgi:hypothetical protein